MKNIEKWWSVLDTISSINPSEIILGILNWNSDKYGHNYDKLITYSKIGDKKIPTNLPVTWKNINMILTESWEFVKDKELNKFYKVDKINSYWLTNVKIGWELYDYDTIKNIYTIVALEMNK